jgi:hypothetical protein
MSTKQKTELKKMNKLKPTYQRSLKGTGIYANGRKAAPTKDGSKNKRALKPNLFGITWG